MVENNGRLQFLYFRDTLFKPSVYLPVKYGVVKTCKSETLA